MCKWQLNMGSITAKISTKFCSVVNTNKYSVSYATGDKVCYVQVPVLVTVILIVKTSALLFSSWLAAFKTCSAYSFKLFL